MEILGIVLAGASAGAGGLFVAPFAFGWINAAIAVAFAGLGQILNSAMAGKAKQPDMPTFPSFARDRVVNFRASNPPHRVVYGEVMLAGHLSDLDSTGGSKEYLHAVTPIAGHRCAALAAEVRFDDQLVGARDTGGAVTEGAYKGHARITASLGLIGQAADPDLLAEYPGWNSSKRGRGITYLNSRLLWDPDVFKTGQAPNIKALARGRRLYDPRASTIAIVSSTAANPAMFTTGAAHGLAAGDPLWITNHAGAVPAVAKEYEVESAPTTTTFTLLDPQGRKAYAPGGSPIALSTGGTGGAVQKMLWTNNWALCIRDFVTAEWGFEAANEEINETECIASANVSDEPVSLGESATFTADAATDILTLAAGRPWRTTSRLRLRSSASLPAPLATATDYYWIRLTATTGKLATSVENARAGTAIDLTTAGTGTETAARETNAAALTTAEIITLPADVAAQTGDRVQVSTTGALPSPLLAATDYWWIRTATATGLLAATAADSANGTAIDLTSTGSGTHMVEAAIGVSVAGSTGQRGEGPGGVETDQVTLASAALHLGTDNPVVLATTGALPAPFVAGTVYYWRYIDELHGQLAGSAGGSAIDITSVGDGAHTLKRRSTFTVTLGSVTGALSLGHDDLDLRTGDTAQIRTSGTLPSPLAAATDYYIIRTARQEIRLAASLANARAGTAIALTAEGSGTHHVQRTAQPRYTADGAFERDGDPVPHLEEMMTAAAGAVIYSQGQYLILAGYYVAPTIELTVDDLRKPETIRPRIKRSELYNAVRGTFVDPSQFWQPTDLPPVENATYEAEDGGEQIVRDIELAYTIDVWRGQRIEKIHLEKSRQGITLDFPAKLTALRLRCWDVVGLTLAKYGWANKPFRIIRWVEAEDFGIDLTLQEEAASSYDWAAGDATIVDPAPDTGLPPGFTVAPPTGLTLSSGTAELDKRMDGTIFSRIKASWTAPADQFVTHGGSIEIEAKKSTEADWRPERPVDGAVTQAWILDVQDGVAYDVRIRSVNTLLAHSEWVAVLQHDVVGKTAPPADVTGAAAQQNGNSVTFRCDPATEIDVMQVEIRYNPAGDTDFAGATPIANILRGLAYTTAAVPPGSWSFLFKAKDTSFNYSAAAARVDLDVANQNDVIFLSAQGPDWLGVKSNFVAHWTGKLIPESTKLASAHTREELFEQFVPYPEALSTYEAPEIDLGFDANGVRVWADISSALGRGVLTGTADPQLEIDYRLAAGSYDGFEPWTIGAVTGRYVKARLKLQAALGRAYISQFTPVLDVAERTQHGEGVAIAAGGATVTFPEQFNQLPNLQVTPIGALVFDRTALSATAFTGKVRNLGGTDTGGTIDWQATGP